MIHPYVLFLFEITVFSTLIENEKFMYAFFIFLCITPLIIFRIIYQIKKPIVTVLFFIFLGFLIHVYVQNKIQVQNDFYNSGFIYQHKQKIELVGDIKTFPSYRYSNNQYTISILNTSTKILVYSQPFEKFVYGDQISFSASLQDIREQEKEWYSYYQKLGVQYVVWNPTISNISYQTPQTFKEDLLYTVFIFKMYIKKKTIELFSSHTSALVLGMLLGEKDELSKEEKDMFNKANLSHILVVSGYNISLVISFIFLLFKSFHRYVRTFFAFIFILLFVLLVGFDASVVRSALMGSAVIFSKIIYRQSSGIHTLFLVATGMILYNPLALFDIGFHLSFLATYSLCILPAFKKVPEYIITTLWVFIFVSVYTIYLSGSVSFIGIITNILVLVLVPVYMFVAFGSLLISIFSISIGVDIFILEIMSRYIFIIAYVAQFAPRFEYQISPQSIVGIYVFLLSCVGFLKNKYTTLEFIEKHYQKFVPQKPS